MEQIAVAKFGGTSLKNIARIQHVADIIEKMPQAKRIIVVSAMGDTTDQLLALAKQCSPHPDQRELDVLISTGEQVSIALLSLALTARGIRAKSFTGAQIGILTDDRHTFARILKINSSAIFKALGENDVVIIAGFQGINGAGDITTLGRGGSDTTAVALAAACQSTSLDVYTDVDGICSADPNLVDNARKLRRISYEETLELARCGAQVIHTRAVELAQQYNVAVRVRNTFNPTNEGTLIQGDHDDMENFESLSGVAVDRGHCCISLQVRDPSPLLAKLSELIDEGEIAADLISQTEPPAGNGISSITLVLKCADADCLQHAVKELTRVGACNLDVEPDLAKVSLVGRGLAGRPRYAANVLSLLNEASIAVKQIICSDLRISCIVAAHDAERACKSIHDRFALDCDIEPREWLAATA